MTEILGRRQDGRGTGDRLRLAREFTMGNRWRQARQVPVVYRTAHRASLRALSWSSTSLRSLRAGRHKRLGYPCRVPCCRHLWPVRVYFDLAARSGLMA